MGQLVDHIFLSITFIFKMKEIVIDPGVYVTAHSKTKYFQLNKFTLHLIQDENQIKT